MASDTARSAACSGDALGEPDLQVDFAARLLDQAVTLGLGGLLDARFLGGDLLLAARLQRIDLAGQRLQLLVDLGELRGGGGAGLLRADQIGAHLLSATVQVTGERLAQEVIETASEDQEIRDPRREGKRAFAVMLFAAMTIRLAMRALRSGVGITSSRRGMTVTGGRRGLRMIAGSGRWRRCGRRMRISGGRLRGRGVWFDWRGLCRGRRMLGGRRGRLRE